MKLKLFFLFIVAFLAIGSCSSRDNDNNYLVVEPAEIYGNWKLESLTIEGNGQKKVFNDECFRRSTILFNGADGKGVERGYGKILEILTLHLVLKEVQFTRLIQTDRKMKQE